MKASSPRTSVLGFSIAPLRGCIRAGAPAAYTQPNTSNSYTTEYQQLLHNHGDCSQAVRLAIVPLIACCFHEAIAAGACQSLQEHTIWCKTAALPTPHGTDVPFPKVPDHVKVRLSHFVDQIAQAVSNQELPGQSDTISQRLNRPQSRPWNEPGPQPPREDANVGTADPRRTADRTLCSK